MLWTSVSQERITLLSSDSSTSNIQYHPTTAPYVWKKQTSFVADPKSNNLLRKPSTKNLKSMRQVWTLFQDPKFDFIKLSNMWGIGIERSNLTIKLTTNLEVWNVTQLLTRKFKIKFVLIKGQRLRGWSSENTMISSTKSVRVNTCTQVLVKKYRYLLFYLMNNRNHIPQDLFKFIKEIGVKNKFACKN